MVGLPSPIYPTLFTFLFISKLPRRVLFPPVSIPSPTHAFLLCTLVASSPFHGNALVKVHGDPLVAKSRVWSLSKSFSLYFTCAAFNATSHLPSWLCLQVTSLFSFCIQFLLSLFLELLPSTRLGVQLFCKLPLCPLSSLSWFQLLYITDDFPLCISCIVDPFF